MFYIEDTKGGTYNKVELYLYSRRYCIEFSSILVEGCLFNLKTARACIRNYDKIKFDVFPHHNKKNLVIRFHKESE